jgi:AcrR family transcriptional regulator
MPPSKKQSRRRGPTASRGKSLPFGREVWLNAARDALIEEGTAGVEVNKLAKRLGITRGGFYWFFKSHEQLLSKLLAYWTETSTVLFEQILGIKGSDGLQKFKAIIDLWIDETDYDPKWDAAVRDWARTSKQVQHVVQRVDHQRIAVLEQIFTEVGFAGMEAHIRARVTYYHQVGYYALGVKESQKKRLALMPFYRRVLMGGDA